MVMVSIDSQVSAQNTDPDVTQVANEIHDGEQQAGQELRFPG